MVRSFSRIAASSVYTSSQNVFTLMSFALAIANLFMIPAASKEGRRYGADAFPLSDGDGGTVWSCSVIGPRLRRREDRFSDPSSRALPPSYLRIDQLLITVKNAARPTRVIPATFFPRIALLNGLDVSFPAFRTLRLL